MRAHANWAKGRLAQFWQGVREWCGDAAYERYLRSAKRRESEPILSASEFYAEQINRKFSRPNRCC